MKGRFMKFRPKSFNKTPFKDPLRYALRNAFLAQGTLILEAGHSQSMIYATRSEKRVPYAKIAVLKRYLFKNDSDLHLHYYDLVVLDTEF